MQSILLVLPEAARLRYTATVLMRAGYHVLSAEGGEEAIQACHSGGERIDLFVIDLTIEGSHGDLLRGMYPGVPALVLADVGSVDILERVRRALTQSPKENA